MSETYNLKYQKDSPTKKALPIVVEGDAQYVVYELNQDRSTKKVPDSIEFKTTNSYCIVSGQNHFIVAKDSSIWMTDCNLFFLEQVDGKWTETDAKKKEKQVYQEAVEASKGACLICVDGHPALAALVKHYDKKWISCNLLITSKDATAMTTFLQSYEDENPDADAFGKVLGDSCSKLPTVISSPNGLEKNAIGIVSGHPKYNEDFIPLIVAKELLPQYALQTERKSESERSAELIREVCKRVGVDNYDDLYLALLYTPSKVALAFACHRVTISVDAAVLELDKQALVIGLENNLPSQQTTTTKE